MRSCHKSSTYGDSHIDTKLLGLLLAPVLELRYVLFVGDLYVVKHSFQLLGVNVTTGNLKPLQEVTLPFFLDLTQQETLAQTATEGIIEDVLVVKVGEQSDYGIELLVDLIVGKLFLSGHDSVDVVVENFGHEENTGLLVDEDGEGFIESLAEKLRL